MGTFMAFVAVLATLAFFVGLVFLIFKKVRKVGLWMAPIALVLAIIGYAVSGSSSGTSNTNADSSNKDKTVTTASNTSSTSTDNDKSKDKKNKNDSLNRTTHVNFSSTIGQQTTKIETAEIRNVIDSGMTDDNGNDVQFALLIKMSVTNNAPDPATAYPSQGHVVLTDGTQLDAIGAADMDYSDAFKDGDIANGATVSGYVIFPLTMAQAANFKSGNFKFDVMCGDENMTDKNYDVQIKF